MCAHVCESVCDREERAEVNLRLYARMFVNLINHLNVVRLVY